MKLEIGHVLFIDIVDYSKGLISEQSESLQKLKEIVRGTEQFRIAEAERKLLRLPTGDGGALVFRNSPEAPVLCAMEIARALKSNRGLRVRMGIHSGPVNEIADLNEQANIAGAGINLAQRVMDCGAADHILLSRHLAEDLEHYPRWQPYLHHLGECEVKHGVRISVVNLYNDEIGNPALPEKFRKAEATIPAPRPTPARLTTRRVVSALVSLVGLLILVGFFGLRSFHSRNQSPNSSSAGAASAKSIAVLPFDNLSSDKENGYFAEGIQDEILTRLSKVAELKVISRTSTQKYKSAPDSLRDVGRQLGVANLLEGSVQKVANAVHVNVQLIRAATDEHLWAESYNRNLDDVFGVEGEVASAIAEQLQTKLTGAEQKAVTDKPTQNPTAYDAYLRGLSIEHNQFSYPAYQQAAADYAEAARLDPTFALAWAHLGVLRSFLHFNGVDTGTNSAAAVKEAADRAMALRPELAEAWIADGAYRYRVLRDFPRALQAYAEAGKRAPNDAFVFKSMAVVERRLGRWKEAELHFQKAAELDPRNFELLTTVGGDFLNYLRRFAEAHATLERALEISPNDEGVFANQAMLFQAEGRLDEAAGMLARISADPKDDLVFVVRSWQAMDERRFDDAIAILKKRIDKANGAKPLDTLTKVCLVSLGYCQEWAGNQKEARETFLRAVAAIKPSPQTVITADTFGSASQLALAYAGLNQKEAALEQAKHAVADYTGDAISQPDAEVALAQIQARFGDAGSAIAALPHLLEVPAGITQADLRFNPLWDPLRKDPRFAKLCQDKH